ncbi:hypothetical protein [Sulfitobacter sp. SK025]|jgi:hypothetical protein|uniref:hypothetical protein n=1 Tax=Sulfitobacter sp. SK025 TaxID=1389011 RepID=UPI000E0AFD27|nr:hypothetical protein [Sulfitobacter sp. SK025]AXI51014.1 hypothetical protein C1J04_08845 [Sulfitobacter sp. SK025]
MDILLTIGIVLALAGGVLSGVVAAAKNRDPVGWGIVGAIFPLLGLIAIAGMPTARRTKGTKTVPTDVEKPTETAARTEASSSEDTTTGNVIILIIFGVITVMVVIIAAFSIG